MVDWDKPLQTRTGRSVRLLGVLKKPGPSTHIVAVDYNGAEAVESRKPDGTYHACCKESTPADIVNTTEKKSLFQNVYENPETSFFPSKSQSMEIAKKIADTSGRTSVGVIEFKYEDDVFVEAVFHPKEK